MSSNADSTKVNPQKQIKLARHTALAIRAVTQRLNALSVEAKAAQDKFQAAADTHQEFLIGLIRDAGYSPEEFERYGVVEEAGEVFLRAK